MINDIANQCLQSNTQAETAEPEMLVIHSPRIQQHAPWGDWAKATAEWLRSNGWRINRLGPDVHAIHPLLVQ